MNRLSKLAHHGQSYWMDDLSREMLEDGSLEARVRDAGLRGVTSNPSILHAAVTAGDHYREQIREAVSAGLSARRTLDDLMTTDVQRACDALRPVYEETDAVDGFVSLEVSPHIARDTRASIADARRFWEGVDRPNLFIKIPGTEQGVPAIEELLYEGINVNVTLLFSVARYEEVAEAYLRALERRLGEGRPVDRLRSVASFFLSRIDVMVDERLRHRIGPGGRSPMTPHPETLLGRAAVANAKLAYRSYQERSACERWQALAGRGARPQRLLWASTGTKDPAYSDVKYVEPLMPRDRRLRATDLGMVVTDKLIEGFPRIMDVAYTREMESHLDEIEEENLDWVQMLKDFYERFKKNLDSAHELMSHAKAETQPAPYKCPECGNDTMYRFGKSGRFLSCSAYPECKYASPIDKEGKPVGEQVTDVLCPKCGGRMTKRKGRFGAFLGCENYPDCDGIINLDKKGAVKVPKTPPITTDLTCPKCEEAPLYCRDSKRGLWLSCSTFPKCRGRQAFNKLDEDKQAELEKAWKQHEKQNPTPVVRTTDGEVIEEDGKHVPHVEAEEIELSTSSGGDEDVSVDDAAA